MIELKNLRSKDLIKSIAKLDRLIIVLDEKELHAKRLPKFVPDELQVRITKALSKLPEKPKASSHFSIDSYEKSEPNLLLSVLPEEQDTFALLGFARGALTRAIDPHTENAGVVILNTKRSAQIADCFSSALAARIFQMPVFGKRAQKVKPFRLKNFTVFADSNIEKALTQGWETGEGGNLVRFLAALPANELNTQIYGKKIQELAKLHHLSFKFYSNVELKKMGAGAFTAVDRGNPDSHGGIYELTYSPRNAKNKDFIALVGKGICFDTGGYDLKISSFMVGMKGDMGGSAVALSTLITASKLKLPLKMKAFLGLTENHISPSAYKPDEVVTALNGMSIEVVNTDAEGRMVLSDTLALACRSKPKLVVDFATLTGAAHIAIGTSYSAGFTNRESLHDRIVECGRRSGERIWTFPLDKDFGKALESPIADILQCTKGRSPDHILAAYFLSQFVSKEVDWVHLDLSAADRDGGLAHTDTLYTGFGVRWAIEFLRTQFKV